MCVYMYVYMCIYVCIYVYILLLLLLFILHTRFNINVQYESYQYTYNKQ